MKVRRIKLENYRRHRNTEVELPEGVTALLGRNGAGKSTLIEAIGFAFFGTPATRTGKDLLRHSDAAPTDAVRVEVDVELGSAVRVVRELRGKNLSPSASLEIDGIVQVAPGAGSGDAVTKKMEELLGMQREGFFTTIVARQKELSRLADESPADRKRLVLELLGIEQIDKAIGKARRSRNEAKAHVDALRGVLPALDELKDQQQAAAKGKQAAQAAVDKAAHEWTRNQESLKVAAQAWDRAQEEKEAFQAAHAALTKARLEAETAAQRVQDFASQIESAEEAEEKAKELEPLAGEAPALRKKVESARDAAVAKTAHLDALKRLEAQKLAVAQAEKARGDMPVLADIRGIEKEAQTLADAAAEAKHEHALADARVKELRQRHRHLGTLGDAAQCPTCEQDLHEHLPKVLEQLEGRFQKEKADAEALREAAAKVQAAADQALAARDAARAKNQATEGAIEARKVRDENLERERKRLDEMRVPEDPGEVPDVAPLRAQLEKAEAAAAQHARLQGEASKLGHLRMHHQASVAASDAAVERLLEVEKACPRADPKKWDAAAAQHAATQTAEREAERAVMRAKQDAQSAAARLEAAEKEITRAKELRSKLRTAEDDVRLWTALAGTSHDGLLDRFKSHLIQRAGPAISEEASRLLARFTGGRYEEVLLDDDYRIFVAEGGVPYTLDRFSGGEADLVHLALRLAVSRLLADRGGAELRFLALDEVFGSLDSDRRSLVVGALGELGGLYTQVILVTHLESLRDALDQSIMVEERDGEAFVTVHTG